MFLDFLGFEKIVQEMGVWSVKGFRKGCYSLDGPGSLWGRSLIVTVSIGSACCGILIDKMHCLVRVRGPLVAGIAFVFFPDNLRIDSSFVFVDSWIVFLCKGLS